MLVRALLEQTRAPDKDICKLLRAPGPREWCRLTIDWPAPVRPSKTRQCGKGPPYGPTEANVRSIYWRGSARRILSDDPTSDRLLCLMETLARTSRSASLELEKLNGHPSDAVRLTATPS